jgi:hypothetical protein
MKENPPLTAEEAAKLTFPCLLEVWNRKRFKHYALVYRISDYGSFFARDNVPYQKAAYPPAEIVEVLHKQFSIQREYPKPMMTWDSDESKAVEGIVIADLGEKALSRYIVVHPAYFTDYFNGKKFDWTHYNNAKPVPEPDPIALEIKALEKRIAELKSIQQKSK